MLNGNTLFLNLIKKYIGDFKHVCVWLSDNRLIHLNESVFGNLVKQISSGHGSFDIGRSKFNMYIVPLLV